MDEYCLLLLRTPLKTFPFGIDGIRRGISVNPLCQRAVNLVKILQIILCSVSGVFFRVQFLTSSSWKNDICPQITNAATVALT